MVVTDAVAALAEELDEQARARVEDRARAVGVRAAVPLGLCLLPAFLLLGIVPLVAAAVEGLRW
jgi:pilus assembly protein TadC